MSGKTLSFSVGLMLLAAIIGCSDSAEKAAPSATSAASGGSSHAGWWCVEHGVPEGICARCDAKLVADFKAKGDWCGEHDRPESQCFICHPEKEAEFAAEYEAKFGSAPPKPEA